MRGLSGSACDFLWNLPSSSKQRDHGTLFFYLATIAKYGNEIFIIYYRDVGRLCPVSLPFKLQKVSVKAGLKAGMLRLSTPVQKDRGINCHTQEKTKGTELIVVCGSMSYPTFPPLITKHIDGSSETMGCNISTQRGNLRHLMFSS